MITSMVRRASALLLILAGVSAARAATIPGSVYLGGQVALTDFGSANETCDKIDNEIAGLQFSGVSFEPNCSTKTTSSGFGAFFGYNLTPVAALELGYADFGKITLDYSVRISGPGSTDVVSALGQGKANATHVSILLHTDNDQGLNFMGRMGLYRATTEISGTVSDALNIVVPSSGSKSDTNTGPLIGIGASLKLSGNLGARLEIDRFQDMGNSDTTFHSNLNMYSLGVTWTFH